MQTMPTKPINIFMCFMHALVLQFKEWTVKQGNLPDNKTIAPEHGQLHVLIITGYKSKQLSNKSQK